MKKLAGCLALFFISPSFLPAQQLQNAPAAVVAAFQSKYPTVRKVSWEKDGKAYAARFHDRDESCTARFSEKGEWLDAVRKINFGELRNNVRNALSQGQYATWRAYEVNEIIERNKEPRYRIRVRSSDDQSERYLFYDAKGQVLTM